MGSRANKKCYKYETKITEKTDKKIETKNTMRLFDGFCRVHPKGLRLGFGLGC